MSSSLSGKPFPFYERARAYVLQDRSYKKGKPMAELVSIMFTRHQMNGTSTIIIRKFLKLRTDSFMKS
eukprot:8507238-Pyramimonas_sp.AAC.1